MPPRRPIRAFSLPALALLAGALVAASTTAGAHELGAAKVMIELTRDGRYRIEAAVFPDHLPKELTDAALDGGALRARTIAAAHVVFDGADEAPREAAADPAHPDAATTLGGTPQVVARFEGALPEGSRELAWRLDLPIGIYLLGVRQDGDENPSFQWIQGAAASKPVALRHAPPRPTRPQLVRRYFTLATGHPLPFSIELALIALALFLPRPEPAALAAQLAAFFAAAPIALGLALRAGIAPEARITVPLIALAVAYLAIDNLAGDPLRAGRLAVLFGFGLVHGATSAGVLLDAGVSRADRTLAVLAYCAGGAAVQVAVAASALLAVGIWFGRKPWYRAKLCAPASVAIAIVGLTWAAWSLLPAGGAP